MKVISSSALLFCHIIACSMCVFRQGGKGWGKEWWGKDASDINERYSYTKFVSRITIASFVMARVPKVVLTLLARLCKALCNPKYVSLLEASVGSGRCLRALAAPAAFSKLAGVWLARTEEEID